MIRIVLTGVGAAVVLAWASAAVSGAGQGTPAAERLSRDWKRLVTPSLVVVGNAHDSDLRRVGLEIERFRQAIQAIFPRIRLDAPVPTTVVVFRDNAALTPFKPRVRGKPNDNVAGYFTSLPHANYIVLAPSGYRPATFQLIFHEYTHYLNNRNFRRLPFWLNEGLAEFYSTYGGDERDGRTIIGRPIDWLWRPCCSAVSCRSRGSCSHRRPRSSFAISRAWRGSTRSPGP